MCRLDTRYLANLIDCQELYSCCPAASVTTARRSGRFIGVALTTERTWLLSKARKGMADSGSRRNTSRRERNHSSVLSVTGSGRRRGAWYGPACPRVKGAARPCGTSLRPALDPRDPPALGQGVAGRAMALPASSARRLMSRGSFPDRRGEPTRRTGGRSPRWVCGSRGVFGAGR